MTDVLPEAAVHKKVAAGILAAVSMAIIRLPMALGADLAEAENNISIALIWRVRRLRTMENEDYSVYPEVTIDGIYQERLYMHYQYVEDVESIQSFVNGDIAYADIPWKYEVKCLDLKTDTIALAEVSDVLPLNINEEHFSMRKITLFILWKRMEL